MTAAKTKTAPKKVAAETPPEPEVVPTPEPEPEPEALNVALNHGPNGLLTVAEGETVELVADMFPAKISPLPAGIGSFPSKLRVIITNKSLTLAWPGGFQNGKPIVNRYDILITDDADNASYQGGEVVAADGTSYTVTRGNGCACGASGLRTWQPFPQLTLSSRPRTGVAQPLSSVRPGAVRYSRS